MPTGSLPRPMLVHPAELMRVICKYREEAFPFERYIGLLTFSSWLHWPNDSDIVDQATTVAAGLVIRMIGKGAFRSTREQQRKQIAGITKAVLQPECVADALANRQLIGSYRSNFESHYKTLYEVSTLASFLLRCPIDVKPSLNKALSFFDEGNSEDTKASRSTLTTSWSEYALIAPFIVAEDWLDFFHITELAPDDEGSIPAGCKILDNLEQLRRYFGVARYLQELLVQRLDSGTLARFQFGEFPECIQACPIEIIPMEPSQVEAVRKYRAPKPSR